MWCVSLYIEWYQLYKSFGIGTIAEVRSYLVPSGSVFLLKVVIASCGTHLMVFSSGEVFNSLADCGEPCQTDRVPLPTLHEFQQRGPG